MKNSTQRRRFLKAGAVPSINLPLLNNKATVDDFKRKRSKQFSLNAIASGKATRIRNFFVDCNQKLFFEVISQVDKDGNSRRKMLVLLSGNSKASDLNQGVTNKNSYPNSNENKGTVKIMRFVKSSDNSNQ